MVSYFHTDLVPYFLHTLECPLHWVAPVVAVTLLVFFRKKRVGTAGTWRFLLLLGVVFVLLYLTDIPAVFGRCPGYAGQKTLQFSGNDLTGLLLGVSAGLVTFLSPCGLPPLPAYIRYFLGAKPSRERSISLSFLSTSGFVLALAIFATVFLILRRTFSSPFTVLNQEGIAPSRVPSGTFVIFQPYVFDLLGYVAGAIALVMGSLMLLRVRIPFFRAPSLGSFNRSVQSVFTFSLAWGTASLACSPYAIFPFLFYAVAKGGVAPFAGFALGMAVPVLSVSLLLGLGKGPLVEKVVRASARLHRTSGLLLVVTGVVIVFYTYFYPSTTGYYLFG